MHSSGCPWIPSIFSSDTITVSDNKFISYYTHINHLHVLDLRILLVALKYALQTSDLVGTLYPVVKLQ